MRSDAARISRGAANSSSAPSWPSSLATRRRPASTSLGEAPRLEPEGHVVDALVAGEALPVAGVEHDGAVLARVVAPDAAHEHLRRVPFGSGSRSAAGAGAVEVDHRFADEDRGLARRRVDQGAAERQAAARVVERPRDHRDRRPRRIEGRAHDPLGIGAAHAGQPRGRLGQAGRQGREVAAARADRRANVEVGGQDGVEPVRERVAKARHHHRQRDREGEAGDDAGDGDVALSRSWRARSTASRASGRRAAAPPRAAAPRRPGMQAMPPIRRHATEA
jgi:hypothetical protein